MSDPSASPGPTVTVHLDAPGSSPQASSSGSLAARNSNANAVEMVPVHVQAAGTANGTASGYGPDGIHASMGSQLSPGDNASPDAGLFQSTGQFPLTIKSLQRLFATETSPEEVQRIIGEEYGGIPGLMASLKTEPTGLDAEMCAARSQSVSERIAFYGENTLPVAVPKTFFEFCKEVLEDTMLRVLMAAGAVSIALGLVESQTEGWYEGAAIWIAIILVTIVSAANNYQQQKQFAAVDVSKELDPVTVIRSGRQFSMDPTEILVGDLVALAAGQRIPADGVMVQLKGQALKVNESAATGETGLVSKKLGTKPLLMSGTEVVSGSCVFLVVLVGINTSYGQTLASLVEEDRETPLQKKLSRVAELIGLMGMSFAILTFIALFIYWLVHLEEHGGWHKPTTDEWSELLDIAVVCVSIVVVAVPEGLPLAVTVSLAYSMKAMLKDNILVRELAACETMGNATAVCSDKTGTLTQNRMTVIRCHLQQAAHDRPPAREELTPLTLRLLEQSIILNSAAWIEDEHVQLSVPPQDWKWKDGNQTEVAMLSWLIGYGFDVNASRSRHAPQLKATESFDSIKKYSSIVLQKTAEEMAEEGPGAKPYRQYFKGAAEAIIASSTRQCNAAGQPMPLPGSGAGIHRELLENVSDFSRRGLRVIAFSYRDLDEVPVLKKSEEQEIEEAKLAKAALKDNAVPTGLEHKQEEGQAFVLDAAAASGGSAESAAASDEPPPITDTTLIGMVGLSDPLRPTSYRSVRLCQRAGIIVRMVTGDHVLTAQFISRECGIWTSKQHLCMTGAEFRKMMEEEDEASKALKISRLRVLARSSPQDKQVLVKYLQTQGQVVAATGDGTNDAPALKAADVGIAMFLSGTAVCKSAADLWLMDDNFASIVAAVVWGRCVFDNIRKFLGFQLTVNVVALMISLVGAITDYPLPLTTVQLLWINLIMDTAAAVALGTEQPRPEELLARAPKAPDGPLLSIALWYKIIGQSVYQLGVLFFMLYSHETVIDAVDAPTNSTKHKTFIFNTFVWLQLGNAFNARRVNPALNVFERIFDNAYFLCIIGAACGVQAMMVELFGSFANTTGQTWDMWLIAMAWGVGSVIWGVVLFQIWQVIIKRFPSWNEDSISRVDADAFEGAHLHDRRYSFKRPEELENSVRQRAKSRSSFSHHGASPLHDNHGKDLAPGVVGAITGNVQSGSSSRLVSSMSARRATNPGGHSARRSGGAVFQPISADDSNATHGGHGELPLDAGAAGASSAQVAASQSWPRAVMGPSGEPVEGAVAVAKPVKGDGGVEVIEELDELI